MQKGWTLVLGGVVLAGAVVLVGCGRKSESDPSASPGVVERTGSALDTAADKTVDAAKATGAATKDVTGKVLEKSGETLEKAGAALEGTGSRMQEPSDPVAVEE